MPFNSCLIPSDNSLVNACKEPLLAQQRLIVDLLLIICYKQLNKTVGSPSQLADDNENETFNQQPVNDILKLRALYGSR